MRRTGQLQINGTESRLAGGPLLARCEAADPIDAGTGFLKAKQLRDGDNIWVEGNGGNVGAMNVFCIINAGRLG